MSFVSKAIGGITGANDAAKGAQKAADSQVAAVEKSNEYLREVNQQNRADAAPYREAGYAGINALLGRLGLAGGAQGGQQAPAQAGQGGQTADQIRQELLGQYTTAATPAGAPAFSSLPADVQAMINREGGTTGYGYDPRTGQYGFQYNQQNGSGDNGPSVDPRWYYTNQVGGNAGSVNEEGLNAAVQQRLAQQSQQGQQGSALGGPVEGSTNPLFGSLLSQYKEYTPYSEQYRGVEYTPYKDYQAVEYTPYRDYQALTADTFQADPGYQFRQQEGEAALQRAAAAGGNLNSGRAAKDLASYNSGLASQEFGNAYQRNLSDYQTGFNSNLQNFQTAYDANLNDYQTGFNSNLQNFNTAYNANLQDYQTGYNTYNNDYTTGFNAFNQNQDNTYNRLMGLVGVGTGVNSQLANGNLATGNQLASNAIQQGNAQAAGQVAAGNAQSNGFNGLLNAGLTTAGLYKAFK